MLGAAFCAFTAEARVNAPTELRRRSTEGEVVYQLCKALTDAGVAFGRMARALVDYLRSIEYGRAVRYAQVLYRHGYLHRHHYNEVRGVHRQCDRHCAGCDGYCQQCGQYCHGV